MYEEARERETILEQRLGGAQAWSTALRTGSRLCVRRDEHGVMAMLIVRAIGRARRS